MMIMMMKSDGVTPKQLTACANKEVFEKET